MAAENTTISQGTRAAAKLLASIRDQGKSGASMPKAMTSFFREVGGEDAFGKMMADDYKAARGEGLGAAQSDNFEYSPKIVMQWADLISRHTSKTDDNKSLDVGSLEDSDLESILMDLGRKQMLSDSELRRTVLTAAIRDDKKFRRMVFDEVIKEEPDLVTNFLRAQGLLVDGEVKNKTLTCNNTVEDDYNPEADEYVEQ